MDEMAPMAERDRKVLPVHKDSQVQEALTVFKATQAFVVIEVKPSEPSVNKVLLVWKAEKVKWVEKECKAAEDDLVHPVGMV